MYLKKIEIHGFKSFVDRTRLNFEPGITGIIGPNGCGKSNVIDAIRWCLGEQGAKSLRSQHMLDVIFNGTQKRPPVGMAEVALTFDNTQNVLPVDYSEVTVTRRIFRSGESEYYLNKAQCRLKDIRDLFLDTGIGTEGYSVMEQGRVEFVLNSKPEDRRSLFEEAAGVSKYNVRREESLRKLEKIDFDLLRLNDSLSLLKDQLKALDAQARKARNYQNLKEELKNIEITEIVNGYRAAAGEIKLQQEELSRSKDDLEKASSSVNSAEALIEDMRLKLHQKDEDYIKVQSESMRLRSELDALENRIVQAKTAQAELQLKIGNLKLEISNDTAEIEKLVAQQGSVNAEFESLCREFEHAGAKLSESEARFAAVTSELETYERNYSELVLLQEESAQSLQSVNNEISQLRSLIAHNEAQTSSRHREMKKIEEKCDPQIKEVDVLKVQFGAESETVKEFENIIAGLSAKIKDLREDVDSARNRISEMEKESSAVSAKLEAFEEMQKGDVYISGTKAVLGMNFEGISGPVYKILKVCDQDENILSHFLGDKLNYLVADTFPAAQNAVRYLKENNLGRANFIVLENLPSSDAVLPDGLRSRISCEPKYNALADFVVNGSSEQDGQITGRYYMQGGSTIEDALSYYTRMKDSDQLEARKIDLDHMLSRERALLEEKLNELERTIGEYEVKQDMLNRKRLDFSLLEKQVSSKEQEIQLLLQEKTVISAELDQVQNEAASLNDELNQHIRSREMLQSNIEQRKTALEQSALAIEQNKASQRTAADGLTDAKVSYSSISERKIAKEKEKEYIDTQLSNFESFRKRRQDELEFSLKDVGNQKSIQAESAEKSRILISEVENVENVVSAIRDERGIISESIRLKSEELHAMKTAQNTVQESVHRLELKLNHNLDKQENAESTLLNSYAIELNTALEKYEPKEVSSEEKSKLQRRIEMMGAVNLAAPEEYEELAQRHDFLNTQMADIVKAKEDLLEVISKINNITKTNFRETYDKVRENFKLIFSKLFKGGEADLVLTNESNLLETGIDIIAQPPGKKLANMMSLSGGEKALTAIAFLFAFYMVRPSPFCILDEVDAPLDEANVGRFTELISGFTHQSQFLMITHSKKTMEIADALYGVTMEEYGVSKLMSVIISKEKPKVALKQESKTEPAQEKGELVGV